MGVPTKLPVSSYNSAAGVLTLSGPASLAASQTALDSVAFAASTSAANPSRTIACSLNDGAAAIRCRDQHRVGQRRPACGLV